MSMGSGKGTQPLLEASRCWARTASAWEKLGPAYYFRARDSYAAALGATEAVGGAVAVARLLMGSELEAQMQLIFECTMARARMEWAALTDAPAGADDASKADAGGSAANQMKVTAGSEVLMQQLLVKQAPSLLAHAQHERLNLARFQAQIGRWYLDRGRYESAEGWLQASLETTDVLASSPSSSSGAGLLGGQGQAGEQYQAQILVQQLLLSLAACIVEQLSVAKSDGMLVDMQGQGQNSIRAGAAAQQLSMTASVGKVMGYLAAAKGESTMVGRHLLVKLACLQGHLDDAGSHLAALMALPPSTVITSGTGPSSSLVPLASAGPAAQVHVHPDFQLIASACRAYAVAR